MSSTFECGMQLVEVVWQSAWKRKTGLNIIFKLPVSSNLGRDWILNNLEFTRKAGVFPRILVKQLPSETLGFLKRMRLPDM